MTLEDKLTNVDMFNKDYIDVDARHCSNDLYDGVEYTFEMEGEPDGVDVQDIVKTVRTDSEHVIADIFAWGDGTLTVFVIPEEEMNKDLPTVAGAIFA